MTRIGADKKEGSLTGGHGENEAKL